MTNRYLRSITADYITGVVSACEGIRDSVLSLKKQLLGLAQRCVAGVMIVDPTAIAVLRIGIALCGSLLQFLDLIVGEEKYALPNAEAEKERVVVGNHISYFVFIQKEKR